MFFFLFAAYWLVLICSVRYLLECNFSKIQWLVLYFSHCGAAWLWNNSFDTDFSQNYRKNDKCLEKWWIKHETYLYVNSCLNFSKNTWQKMESVIRFSMLSAIFTWTGVRTRGHTLGGVSLQQRWNQTFAWQIIILEHNCEICQNTMESKKSFLTII